VETLVKYNPNQTRDVNLAVGRPAAQSSIYQGFPASLAVDGVTGKNFGEVTHTLLEFSWWSVELDGIHQVAQVTVIR
jgi:hypothetical protein